MKPQLIGLWRRGVRATGHSGPPGIVLLVAAVALAAATPRFNRQLSDEYVAIDARAMSGPARAADSVGASHGRDRLASYVEAFPPPLQMAADLGEIFTSADRQGLALAKGEYQFKVERDSPFVAYVASFPVRGEYGVVKAFASDVLQNVPHASLDELKFNREAADGDVLDAVVRFTLTYRSQ